MVEAVIRAKGLAALAKELGIMVENVVYLGTDSNAAKSFVSRRGLGKMKHIEIKELWIQMEVAKGLIKVEKVKGKEIPADLMTKYLTKLEIEGHLRRMNIKLDWKPW